ncbi:hypothetical protein ElyMa_003848600 [Elysia marginata]|uniref:Uncharacterized protein n=1 Tax=Elysia marginata TaxID=1093978 RepID=A0AAV4FIM0_9GAST|nr:hypothetical protein ElyMa_003848600 [Elysia marginata]
MLACSLLKPFLTLHRQSGHNVTTAPPPPPPHLTSLGYFLVFPQCGLTTEVSHPGSPGPRAAVTTPSRPVDLHKPGHRRLKTFLVCQGSCRQLPSQNPQHQQ